MKTDQQLKADIERELDWDPAIDAAHVGVSVKDGIVTLTGHLESHAQKDAVEHAVGRVCGVTAIAMDIDVRLAPEHVRDDTEIAKAAQFAIRWNSSVPADTLHLKVERGWITLAGEVDWDYQRRAAERCVRSLIGVRGVSNDVTLKVRVAPSDVATRIGEALARHAESEARDIQVAVSASTVTLRGKVDSWAEQAIVNAAAWSAPGVTRVISQLAVNR
jgi:osmotically-inducible protein OsmY